MAAVVSSSRLEVAVSIGVRGRSGALRRSATRPSAPRRSLRSRTRSTSRDRRSRRVRSLAAMLPAAGTAGASATAFARSATSTSVIEAVFSASSARCMASCTRWVATRRSARAVVNSAKPARSSRTARSRRARSSGVGNGGAFSRPSARRARSAFFASAVPRASVAKRPASVSRWVAARRSARSSTSCARLVRSRWTVPARAARACASGRDGADSKAWVRRNASAASSCADKARRAASASASRAV